MDNGQTSGQRAESARAQRAAKQHDARERRHAHRRGDFLDFPVYYFIRGLGDLGIWGSVFCILYSITCIIREPIGAIP